MAFVVFAGQSNTGGYGQSAATLPQAWTPDPNIKIWDAGQKAWATYNPGVNSGYAGYTSGWGPEMAFALAFRQEHPGETLYMVKHAEGGTGLAVDPAQWAFDWSPTSDAELFDRVTAMINDASQSLGGARPEALFWGQGEEDANSQADAQAYAQNLQAFLAAARAEWLGDPNGKVAFFQISGYAPFIGDVRQGQATVDAQDPNAWSFDPSGYAMQNDSVHYAADGYRRLGEQFYRLYDGWQGGGSVGGGQQLNGTAAADSLIGGAGDDSIAGAAGLDFLRGGEGNDLMSGGADFDDMHGNQGNDTLAGGLGDDWVVGGKDQDRLFGDEGGDIVYGNLGDDYCDGGADADLVRGGQGNDIVLGGAGDDWLSGDRGDDTVTGGSGADIFHSFGDAGLDRVTDFSRAEGDRIQLDAGTTWQVSQQGADTLISLSGGGQVVLVGVDSATLSGDWIFTL